MRVPHDLFAFNAVDEKVIQPQKWPLEFGYIGEIQRHDAASECPIFRAHEGSLGLAVSNRNRECNLIELAPFDHMRGDVRPVFGFGIFF